MLTGLALHRHTEHLQCLLDKPDTCIYLEARIADRMIPVYRWSRSGSGILIHGESSGNIAFSGMTWPCLRAAISSDDRARSTAGDEKSRGGKGWHEWNAEAQLQAFCTAVDCGAVGWFVLSLYRNQLTKPAEQEIAHTHALLSRAADVVSKEARNNG